MILQQLNPCIYSINCRHTYQICHASNAALIWGWCFLEGSLYLKVEHSKELYWQWFKLTELTSFDYIRAKLLIRGRPLICGIWVNILYGKHIPLHDTEITATDYLRCLKEELPPIWSDKSKYKGFLDIISSSTSQSMVNS